MKYNYTCKSFVCHHRESIFGYKDLQIQMFYTAARLNTYLNLKYTDKISPQKHDGLKVRDNKKLGHGPHGPSRMEFFYK